jgi:hypothetical protein
MEVVPLFSLSLVAGTNLILNLASHLGSKAESLSSIIVDKVMQGDPVEAVPIPSHPRDVVRCLKATSHRPSQSLGLLFSRGQLALQSYLHGGIIPLGGEVKGLRPWRQFLPHPLGCGSPCRKFYEHHLSDRRGGVHRLPCGRCLHR